MKKGTKHSEEARAKIREARSKQIISHSEETRRKISLSHIGIRPSLETRMKSSEWHKQHPVNYWLGKRRPELSVSMQREKNWSWIRDRTLLKDNSRDRGGSLHREWSRSVKRRDGCQCRIANGDCAGQVVAHHILPWAKFPELRYEVNNGITLCRFHHPRKRDEEMKLSPYFQNLVISNSK